MVSEKDFSQRLAAFEADFDAAVLTKAMEEIRLFNEKFPRHAIEALTKERYALGRGRDKQSNFSWWVEFGTATVASMGGYASKHRLRFNSEEGQYKYPKSYRNADECCDDIRANLLKLYDLVREDRLSDFEEVDLPPGQKLKVSYLIDSDRFMPMTSQTHLVKICKELGIDSTGLNSLQQNRRILEWFRNDTSAADWHTWKIMKFCYSPQGFDLKGTGDGVKVPAVTDDLIMLLARKKQIVLYGPPGTGKTYTTRRIAVSVIHTFDCAVGLVEYDQLEEAQSAESTNTPSNPLWAKIDSFVQRLAAVEPSQQATMMAYYSPSRGGGKKTGLVWLEYPATATGSFTVHLRRETDDREYPQEIVKRIAGFKRIGWGGYPSFAVKDDRAAEDAMELVEYAYTNL